MARIARVVLPGVAHHVTQRGVRSMDIFRSDQDRLEYLMLMSQQIERVGLKFIAYCLMTNHIHLLVIPLREDSLRLGIGEAHRLYTRYVNFKEKTRGHLFQERFYSCPLDDQHLIAAARYVERNPVRAGICKWAEAYKWSSAKFNSGIESIDILIEAIYKKIGSKNEWRELLKTEPENTDVMRMNFRTGRPYGSDAFIDNAETECGRILRRKKPGPKILN